MVVFHHNDIDGRCAGAIIKYYVNTAQADGDEVPIKFVEMDYAKPVPLDKISKHETVWIVDFSFKPEVMAELRTITESVYWLDHHITAKRYDYGVELLGVRDFSEKGLSGAELTWNYLMLDRMGVEMPWAVRLIGDYDSWRLYDAPECFAFYEGLKLEKHGPEEDVWPCVFNDPGYTNTSAIIKKGGYAIKYRDSYCEDFRGQFGFETSIDGVKAYACNFYRFGSLAFGPLFDKYPICIAFAYNGQKWTVSMYSKTEDVSVIAKNHGGGGHIGAAGFSCEVLPFKKEV